MKSKPKPTRLPEGRSAARSRRRRNRVRGGVTAGASRLGAAASGGPLPGSLHRYRDRPTDGHTWMPDAPPASVVPAGATRRARESAGRRAPESATDEQFSAQRSICARHVVRRNREPARLGEPRESAGRMRSGQLRATPTASATRTRLTSPPGPWFARSGQAVRGFPGCALLVEPESYVRAGSSSGRAPRSCRGRWGSKPPRPTSPTGGSSLLMAQ